MNKIKEIEKRLIHAEKFVEQLQIEQDCRYLLHHIKKLEERIEELYKLIEKEKP